MKYCFSILLCFLLSSAGAQDISGFWKGTITQDKGGYRSEYALELWLVQKGDSITGKSFVFVDDIYAEMNVSGNFHKGIYLQLEDDKIVSHEELDGMEWCIKSYQLSLKKNEGVWKFEGHWQGLTSFSACVPGKIFLKKIRPRA